MTRLEESNATLWKFLGISLIDYVGFPLLTVDFLGWWPIMTPDLTVETGTPLGQRHDGMVAPMVSTSAVLALWDWKM